MIPDIEREWIEEELRSAPIRPRFPLLALLVLSLLLATIFTC